MKIEFFIAAVAFFAITSGVFVPPRPGHNKHLLGAKECTWGPSYWCKNLTAASGCHAVKHCIQTVWIHKQLPADNSTVCQTCINIVKQARDQLESNETQEELKEVFEGTCALLIEQEIVKACDKIVDEFIPELVETLASEMNPQVVCSVAGLCNNEKYLKFVAEEKAVAQPKTDTCEGCHTVVGIMEDKFNKMSRDDVLQGFLELCGKTGSLSDACSNIVITYFTEIYNHLKDNFNTNDVCLMSGECSAKFHTHAAKVEITPISHIGYVPVGDQKDDLPCELCEQLVSHLRDLLVANTTEDEFKLVLQGICRQTRSFQNECLSLVDQYYAVAYNFLVTELNPNTVCTLAGICPRNKTQERVPIIPLLPVESVPKALEITPAPRKPTLSRINVVKDGSAVKVMQNPEQAQLPIDLLVPPHTQVLYDSRYCVFCEYFLHYLQQVITSPKSEEEIKEVIDKACSKLPRSINSTCAQFVDMYEPALVALLAQEIDPAQICPLIKACPANDARDVEIFMHAEQGDNSKCPLCLFAVSKLEEMVKNKKTEENIKDALNKLCSHLPSNLAVECNDFVDTYTDELVELLIADLSPQEVCVYLKLCTDDQPARDYSAGDISTNLIADDTINGKAIQPKQSVADPQCVICEFVMRQVQDELKDNKTEDEIKRIVHGICNHLPRTVGKECNDFVDEYADTVIQLLIEATVPNEICHMIHLCATEIKQMQSDIFECAVCEALAHAMEKIIDNPKVDHTVDHVLEKACRALPKKTQSKCHKIIEKYGKTIFNLVIHLSDKGLVCKEARLCASEVARPKRDVLVGANKCTWGPSYWCASNENAEKCGSGAKQHCQERVWFAKSRPARQVGGSRCTWGPSYWCASNDNAEECGAGAKKHCQEKVWKQETKP